jgi:hypothetical protein
VVNCSVVGCGGVVYSAKGQTVGCSVPTCRATYTFDSQGRLTGWSTGGTAAVAGKVNTVPSRGGGPAGEIVPLDQVNKRSKGCVRPESGRKKKFRKAGTRQAPQPKPAPAGPTTRRRMRFDPAILDRGADEVRLVYYDRVADISEVVIPPETFYVTDLAFPMRRQKNYGEWCYPVTVVRGGEHYLVLKGGAYVLSPKKVWELR